MTGVPLWLQVALYARRAAGEDRVVHLEPWELLKAVDPTLATAHSQISRAIRQAEKLGFLAKGSTARRLALPERDRDPIPGRLW